MNSIVTLGVYAAEYEPVSETVGPKQLRIYRSLTFPLSDNDIANLEQWVTMIVRAVQRQTGNADVMVALVADHWEIIPGPNAKKTTLTQMAQLDDIFGEDGIVCVAGGGKDVSFMVSPCFVNETVEGLRRTYRD